MSAAGRGAVRREYDAYYTPAWCVDRLLDTGVLPSGNWLEPAAGNGAIIKAVSKRLPSIVWSANEIRPDERKSLIGVANISIGDFLESTDKTHYDVIITNPPYSQAKEFIEKSLLMADHVVMLLRINFLAGKCRYTLFKNNMPDIYVLPDRPSFTDNNNTDASSYAWFHFHRRNNCVGSIELLATTPIQERR